MDTPHRIKLPITLTLDGALGVALPWYDGLMYDDGGSTAWVNVPPEDCPCRFSDTATWHEALTAKYGPPQKVTAWSPPPTTGALALDVHDPAPRIEGERIRARVEDRYVDARPGARAALVKALREVNRETPARDEAGA